MKKRAKPKAREVILLVRPVTDAKHPWWPAVDGLHAQALWPSPPGYQYASIDPYDPPGWSAGLDNDYKIDSIELWKQTSLTIEQHIEGMKAEWLDEYGKDENGDGYAWEFRIFEVTTTSAQEGRQTPPGIESETTGA